MAALKGRARCDRRASLLCPLPGPSPPTPEEPGTCPGRSVRLSQELFCFSVQTALPGPGEPQALTHGRAAGAGGMSVHEGVPLSLCVCARARARAHVEEGEGRGRGGLGSARVGVSHALNLGARQTALSPQPPGAEGGEEGRPRTAVSAGATRGCLPVPLPRRPPRQEPGC